MNSTTKSPPRGEKAYKSKDFLCSRSARPIRVLCEYQEPKGRLEKNGVSNTVLFFASARGKTRSDLTDEERTKAQADLLRLTRTFWMCGYYEKVRGLARGLAQWSTDRREKNPELPTYSICTGGGPGMMEAANHGASEVQGSKSVGMGIELPFEPGLNAYVTPELAFEFHYFFTRKFWMAVPCKALVVAPGGMGTMDELFEILRLVQVGKMQNIPVVLFGEEYWAQVINWDVMEEFGTITKDDVKDLFFTDEVDKALEYITSHLTQNEPKVHEIDQHGRKRSDSCMFYFFSNSIFFSY
eukprot:GSMAST32.ASY1.ANO1.2284.1 assembled CDS